MSRYCVHVHLHYVWFGVSYICRIPPGSKGMPTALHVLESQMRTGDCWLGGPGGQSTHTLSSAQFVYKLFRLLSNTVNLFEVYVHVYSVLTLFVCVHVICRVWNWR